MRRQQGLGGNCRAGLEVGTRAQFILWTLTSIPEWGTDQLPWKERQTPSYPVLRSQQEERDPRPLSGVSEQSKPGSAVPSEGTCFSVRCSWEQRVLDVGSFPLCIKRLFLCTLHGRRLARFSFQSRVEFRYWALPSAPCSLVFLTMNLGLLPVDGSPWPVGSPLEPPGQWVPLRWAFEWSQKMGFLRAPGFHRSCRGRLRWFSHPQLCLTCSGHHCYHWLNVNCLLAAAHGRC